MGNLNPISPDRRFGQAALITLGMMATLGLSPTVNAATGYPLEPPSSFPQPLAQASAMDLTVLLDLVNEERAKVGVAPLGLNDHLMAAAQGHAQDMANTRRLSHTGSNGSTMRSRIEATGYDWSAIGENVAMGQTSAAAVMQSWLNSPGHRRNMLNPNFTELGLGYALGGGRPYWVQVFAKPQ